MESQQHSRKTSNALDVSVTSEQIRFQKFAEVYSGLWHCMQPRYG